MLCLPSWEQSKYRIPIFETKLTNFWLSCSILEQVILTAESYTSTVSAAEKVRCDCLHISTQFSEMLMSHKLQLNLNINRKKFSPDT